MKFSLVAVLAATCASPTLAEFFFKEQFNDDVSAQLVVYPGHFWYQSDATPSGISVGIFKVMTA